MFYHNLINYIFWQGCRRKNKTDDYIIRKTKNWYKRWIGNDGLLQSKYFKEQRSYQLSDIRKIYTKTEIT